MVIKLWARPCPPKRQHSLLIFTGQDQNTIHCVRLGQAWNTFHFANHVKWIEGSQLRGIKSIPDY